MRRRRHHRIFAHPADDGVHESARPEHLLSQRMGIAAWRQPLPDSVRASGGSIRAGVARRSPCDRPAHVSPLGLAAGLDARTDSVFGLGGAYGYLLGRVAMVADA